MESSSIKLESLFDNINSLKAKKCQLEETLKAVTLERKRKQAKSAALARKRAAIANESAKRGECLKLLQHRVAQQQAEIKGLRREVASKSESIKQYRAEVPYNVKSQTEQERG